MKRNNTHYLSRGLLSLALVLMITGNARALFGTGVLHQSLSSPGGIALLASAAENKGEPQALCPITGEKIDKSVYLDYEGKRVYFCCAACKDAFLKDPKKHIQAMESKGIVLERCPEAKDKKACQPGTQAGPQGSTQSGYGR